MPSRHLNLNRRTDFNHHDPGHLRPGGHDLPGHQRSRHDRDWHRLDDYRHAVSGGDSAGSPVAGRRDRRSRGVELVGD
jgi:hypothetical protein